MPVQVVEQTARKAPKQKKTGHQKKDAKVTGAIRRPEQTVPILARRLLAHNTSQSLDCSKRTAHTGPPSFGQADFLVHTAAASYRAGISVMVLTGRAAPPD